MVFDPCQQTAIEDVAGQWSFKFGTADEEDEGMNGILAEAEELRQGFYMEMVLMERILEAVLGSIDLLGPLALLFRPEDPAFVVLRLDDEDTEFRDDDVVDLGGTDAVGPGQIEVVELPIELRIQPVQATADHPFADRAFKTSRTDESYEDVDA